MNGILLIDKPEGWTSSDVVAKLRGILHERRIGHSGTLDPMATGLLVVFVGRATRAVEFSENHDKTYLAGLRAGIVTDTQDTTGQILSRTSPEFDEEQFRSALSGFEGEQWQLPPMYSAIKVNGQKLYDIARRGGEVERKPRRITISSIKYLGRQGMDYSLSVSCSKGTYIRTLCHDIGRKLGCGACMSSLRRITAGNFSLDHAYTLEQVQQTAARGCAEQLLLPVDSLFPDIASITVNSAKERKLRCGNDVKSSEKDGTYRVYSESGEFLLLGSVEGGRLKTIKSFFEVKGNNL